MRILTQSRRSPLAHAVSRANPNNRAGRHRYPAACLSCCGRSEWMAILSCTAGFDGSHPAPNIRASTTGRSMSLRVGENKSAFPWIDGQSHRQVYQPGQANNRHHLTAFSVESHNLFAPLLQLFQLLVSSAIFVYPSSITNLSQSSLFFVPSE